MQLLNRVHPAGLAPPPAAPWRLAFLSHIQEMASPTFVLSTIHNTGAELVPRARTVVFRGMWASLPANPRNPAELNPDVFTSDLPAITTDVRMEKVPELLGKRASEQRQQSGIGGPVEAVFWAAKSATQWRLRGRAYVIAPDIESEAAAPVREALQPWMREVSTETGEEDTGPISGPGPWSWSRELTAHFGNLSPLMRGSFRNPMPGTPLAQQPDPELGLGLGQEVENVHDRVARNNFRVLVIMPEEVDRVDLSDPKRARRWNYQVEAADAGDSSWTTTELWP